MRITEKVKGGWKITRTCDCRRMASIVLTDQEYDDYCEWRAGRKYIQELTTLNACEREFLKTGLCKECQKMIFNNGKSDRISQ